MQSKVDKKFSMKKEIEKRKDRKVQMEMNE